MKQRLLALLMVLSVLCASAQTTYLTTDKGWTNMTTIPTNPNLYFFSFVEKSQGYSLGMKDGQNQSGYKTMALKDLSDPAEVKDVVWSIINTDGHYNITNITYPNYYFQTEWNAGWRWRCSDNGGGASDWGWIRINAVDDGGFQLQQDKYETYIGPWDVAIVKNNEFAANRSQAEAPVFDIYQIPRGNFVAYAEKLASASSSNPLDITYTITNADATFRNMNGWTQEYTGTRSNDYTFQTQNNGGLGNANDGYFFEAWQGNGNLSDRKMYQTIQNLPSGNYRLTVRTDCDAAGAILYANNEEVELNTKVDGVATVEFSLNGSTNLELGLKLVNHQSNWFKCDYFVLQYIGGASLDLYVTQLAETRSLANTILQSGDKMNADVRTALQTAYNNSASVANTADAYTEAIEALNQAIADANASVAIYQQIAVINDRAAQLDLAGQTIYASTLQAYNNGTLTSVSQAEEAYEAARNAQTFTGPAVPGANLETLNGETTVYMYNVEADAFVTYGMNWNTEACATRLTNGDTKVSIPQQAYALVDNGTVQVKLGAYPNTFISAYANKNDVWVDQNHNTHFEYTRTSTSGYCYTLKCEGLGTMLDLSQAYGGQLTGIDGQGLTEWAFIPESAITNGSYAAYKARVQLYKVMLALNNAGVSSTYSSEIAEANAVYTSATATASEIRAAARKLFFATATSITSPLDASFLFTDADMVGAGSAKAWTYSDIGIGWAVFEEYFANITFEQSATVPVGTYDVKVRALYRTDNEEATPQLVATGTNTVSVNVPLVTGNDWGVNNENGGNGWVYNANTGYHQPNNMQSSGQAMTSTAAVATASGVTSSGDLTITLAAPTSWFTIQGFNIIFKGTNNDALKSALVSIINEANSLYSAGKNGAAAFKTVIDQATTVKNNNSATPAQIQNAINDVRTAMADFKLKSATTSSPIDFSSWVLNPSFEYGFRDWTQEGMQTQTNDGITPKDGNVYCEKWTALPGTLKSGYVRQAVPGTPMGVYKMVAAAHNVLQESTKTCTGVYLTGNIDRLTVNTDQDYTMTFTNIEDSIDVGLLIKNSTGNWAACDNFRLYYCGWDATKFDTQMQTYITSGTSLYSSRLRSDLLADVKTKVNAAQAELTAKDTADYPKVSRPLRLAIEKAQLSIDAYAALKTAIDEANSKYKSTLAGAATYREAIDAAQALYDADTDNDVLYAMIPRLERAGLVFDTSHGTGAIPTITTDSRTARGAVRMFGRFTYTLNGASLKARGFAYATHKGATIADGMSTREFDNNGIIYVIEDVEPATKYYIRPFVITTGNQIAYGDELKVITLPHGTATWSYNNGGSGEENDRINAAIRYGIDTWNEMMSLNGFHLSANYGSGTPTADCSFGGYMRIGPSASYQRTGTIMHEAAHGVGVGTAGNWWWVMNNGVWRGDRANNFLKFWDNDDNAMMYGDSMHMWPYGINGAHEDNGSDQLYYGNAMIIQGMHEDGLGQPSGEYAEAHYAFDQEDDIKYYIKSEDENGGMLTSFLTFDQKTNKLVYAKASADEAKNNDRFAWTITFDPAIQMYQLKNVSTGQYITNTDGYLAGNNATNFQFMRSRYDAQVGNYTGRGYWIFTGGVSIGAGTNGATTPVGTDIADEQTTQRWFILTASELNAVEGGITDIQRNLLAEAIAKVREMAETPHTEVTAGAGTTLNTTLNSIQAQGNASNITPNEIDQLISNVYAAGLTFCSQCRVTGDPFDITFLMTDPELSTGDGWEGNAPYRAWNVNEYYQTTFDYYQIVDNLPAGDYAVTCQGFQRPGEPTDVYNKFIAGDKSGFAYLYAGDEAMPLMNIYEDAQSESISNGESSMADGTVFVPNGMEAAANYFGAGLYNNQTDVTLENNNSSLQFGVRGLADYGYSWTCFDNFHLYYYGVNQDIVGDINLDGKISILDIVQLVRFLRGESIGKHGKIDVNGDTVKDEKDVQAVGNLILAQ